MVPWRPAALILALAATLPLVACSGPEPYIYKKREFDRSAPNFGKDPKNIGQVIVCYNSRGSTPEDVVALARAGCRAFNRKPVFEKQDYRLCPLLTPVAAYFVCAVR